MSEAEPRDPAGAPEVSPRGWSVRESVRPRTHEDAAETRLPDDPAPPPVAAEPPALPSTVRTARSRQALAVLGVVALFGGVGAGVILMTGHPTAARSSASNAGSQLSQASPTPDPATVSKAAQDYVAAVQPLDGALATLELTVQRQEQAPCACPTGEFYAAPVFAQIPEIDNDIYLFQAALNNMKYELPAFGADIDKVLADNQKELDDFAAALRTFEQGDTFSTSYLAAVGDDELHAVPDVTRLRADLKLPKPAGADISV